MGEFQPNGLPLWRGHFFSHPQNFKNTQANRTSEKEGKQNAKPQKLKEQNLEFQPQTGPLTGLTAAIISLQGP